MLFSELCLKPNFCFRALPDAAFGITALQAVIRKKQKSENQAKELRFDFAMNSVSAQKRIVLFQFKLFCGVALVLECCVAAGAFAFFARFGAF